MIALYILPSFEWIRYKHPPVFSCNTYLLYLVYHPTISNNITTMLYVFGYTNRIIITFHQKLFKISGLQEFKQSKFVSITTQDNVTNAVLTYIQVCPTLLHTLVLDCVSNEQISLRSC